MPLAPNQRANLIDILVASVPAPTFSEVVREQNIVSNFDLFRKQALDDPDPRRFIITRVVDEYDAAKRVSHLARALYRRTFTDDQFAPQIAAYLGDDSVLGDAAKQAALVQRANTMSSRKLRDFLEQNEAKVCLIAVANEEPGAPFPLRLGTGFLVGPDTVLTAYHTLAEHIESENAKQPPPGPRCAIFDYYEGDPLEAMNPIPAGSQRVEFHPKDWLLDWNQDMPEDGLILNPDAKQLALLGTRLDFALIRLAEPVGKQTRRRAGGARRSWVKLSAAALALANDARIIIPQHPNGFPQRIDFGRFSQAASALDTSATRLRYDTETDSGTSGAPCFDQQFSLVGMHNARFSPNGQALKNQAIRIDRILQVLKANPGDDVEAAPVRLWNVSATSEPQVILGRQTLVDWIALATIDPSRACKERVYAAVVKAEDRTKSSGYGKTFTAEILKAARRDSAEPIVMLGSLLERVPDTAADFVRAIGFQLGINQATLDQMPSRPSSTHPAETPNADKLSRWASEDIPGWFDDVLRGFREMDRRDDAKKRIAYLKAGGLAPNAEDLALAQETSPQLGTRWSLAWIVINVPDTGLKDEVQNCLAGLIGAKATEASMPQQLRRLRWLFIGDVPDFLSPDQFTPEILDPMEIGSDELVEGVRLLGDSMAVDTTAIEATITLGVIHLLGKPGVVNAAADDPAKRLKFYQQTLFLNLRDVLLEIVRVKGQS